MKNRTLARRYGRALFDLARDESILERIGRELRVLADAIAHSEDIRVVLHHPSISAEDRRAVLDALLRRMGASELFRRFVAVVDRRHRLDMVGLIAEEYEHLLDAHARRVRVRVEAAISLGPREVAPLREALARATGARDVRVEVRVNEALLGGIVAHMEDIVLDTSLRTRLENLKQRLLATS